MLRRLNLRFSVQLLFFIVILLSAINHNAPAGFTSMPIISNASIHVLCPFGAVVSFYKLITTGTFVNKIHESAMIIFSATLFLSILFGPVFCSWVCPFGTLQEMLASLGRRLGTHGRVNLPRSLSATLNYTRYAVLIWTIYITARSGQLLFADYDPYYALFNFWSGEVAVSALIILVITIMSSLFVERPWCKYACPFGALLGISNKIRIFSIHRSKETCISCSLCDASCPMNIGVSSTEKVTSSQCISCYKCTSEFVCPISDTVQVGTGGVHQ